MNPQPIWCTFEMQLIQFPLDLIPVRALAGGCDTGSLLSRGSIEAGSGCDGWSWWWIRMCRRWLWLAMAASMPRLAQCSHGDEHIGQLLDTSFPLVSLWLMSAISSRPLLLHARHPNLDAWSRLTTLLHSPGQVGVFLPRTPAKQFAGSFLGDSCPCEWNQPKPLLYRYNLRSLACVSHHT